MAEIGAGWGRLGHMLLSINPTATYVVLDLPETLLVSSSYLPHLMPGVAAVPYEQARSLSKISRSDLARGGLWFLGTQDIAKLEPGSIDAFVNISSFQEMEPQIVNNYLRQIDRCAAGGVLYTLNMRQGVMSELADYEFPPAWQALFNRPPLHSTHLFEAAFRIKAGSRDRASA